MWRKRYIFVVSIESVVGKVNLCDSEISRNMIEKRVIKPKIIV